MWIANCSLDDIKKGNHPPVNRDTLLIQICDTGTEFPIPTCNFVKTAQFNFLDTNNIMDDGSIEKSDVTRLGNNLVYAWNHKLNVLVHCHAGICRSGAVVEAGKLMGFTAPVGGWNNRIPNTLVFNKLRIYLGFVNSWDE